MLERVGSDRGVISGCATCDVLCWYPYVAADVSPRRRAALRLTRDYRHSAFHRAHSITPRGHHFRCLRHIRRAHAHHAARTITVAFFTCALA
jgi:hypothetical protein